jgi:hypothetical protein
MAPVFGIVPDNFIGSISSITSFGWYQDFRDARFPLDCCCVYTYRSWGTFLGITVWYFWPNHSIPKVLILSLKFAPIPPEKLAQVLTRKFLWMRRDGSESGLFGTVLSRSDIDTCQFIGHSGTCPPRGKLCNADFFFESKIPDFFLVTRGLLCGFGRIMNGLRRFICASVGTRSLLLRTKPNGSGRTGRSK